LSGRIRETVDVLEKARNSFQGMNEALRFGGNQLVDVIDRATQKGAKFGDIMEDVFNNLKRQMLQAALTGEGALAKLFGLNSSVPGGVGGLLGALGKLGGFDEGGYTGHGGKYQVAGLVHRGEYVFDAAATRRIGVPALRALQRGDIGFFSGGFTGGPSGYSSGRGYGGAPNIRFNIQNNGASVSQPTVRRDSDGGFTFDMIVDAVEGKIAGNAMGNRGPMSDAIKSVSHGQNGWG
jgi:lambda family phage tail tape measure protein